MMPSFPQIITYPQTRHIPQGTTRTASKYQRMPLTVFSSGIVGLDLSGGWFKLHYIEAEVQETNATDDVILVNFLTPTTLVQQISIPTALITANAIMHWAAFIGGPSFFAERAVAGPVNPASLRTNLLAIAGGLPNILWQEPAMIIVTDVAAGLLVTGGMAVVEFFP